MNELNSNLDVGVRANVSEDGVHAEQVLARADPGVVGPGHGMEVGDALALLQDLVVGRRKQTIGQSVPKKSRMNVH